MIKHPFLWAFPLASLAVIVVVVSRAGEVEGPTEVPDALTHLEAYRLAERNENLEETLRRAADARDSLGRHVVALREEVSDLRALCQAHEAEHELWRDGYAELEAQFERLAELASVRPAIAGGEILVPPRPTEAVFVREPGRDEDE